MRVGSLNQRGEPNRNGLTERTESGGRLEFESEADGNGRDRSLFTWRDRVQAEAEHYSRQEWEILGVSAVLEMSSQIAGAIRSKRRMCSDALESEVIFLAVLDSFLRQ